MASLSQARLLGYLPSPHRALQEHAAHSIEWPMALSSKGSSSTCIPEVLRHSSILLSRRSRTSTPRHPPCTFMMRCLGVAAAPGLGPALAAYSAGVCVPATPAARSRGRGAPERY